LACRFEETPIMDHLEDIGYEQSISSTDQPQLKPLEDFLAYLREYARERPEVVALTCLGIGFILGWKLKPW
jgi:hypothetical protein